jgi:DNA polymerase III alpha subunit
MPLYGIELDVLLPITGSRKAESIAQPALLFARSPEGLRNLAKVASEAYSGWPGIERALPWDMLAANTGELLLILLGGDEAGALTPCAMLPAKKLVEWSRSARSAFPEAAFIGLPHAGRPGDSLLAEQVAAAAAALDLPVVATPAARYLRPDDAPSYEALKVARRRAGWPRGEDMAASTASIAPDRPGHDYLRSPEEATALYTQWPQAIDNIACIVEMCNVTAEGWPFHNEPASAGNDFLPHLARKRLLARLGPDALPPDIDQRLDRELDITKHQHGTWIALTALLDIAKGGKPDANPTPIGAPTGAASGSLLAYALSISPIAPTITQSTTHNHALERSEGSELRTQNSRRLPGLEVPAGRRDALLAALAGEYGAGRVACAACLLPIMPTQAVQAAGRVLSITGDHIKTLALATIEQGWDALSPDHGLGRLGSTAEPLPALALALRGAPLTFCPDPDTLFAAPRQTHGSETLAQYGPLLAGDNIAWLPWTGEEGSSLGYPAFALRPTQPLAALDSALALARRFPVPGFQADGIDISTLPTLSDAANGVLSKGELTGIPYLTAQAAKAWSGDATLESAAQMVARSLYPARPPVPEPKPAGWDEITAETGGALLFDEQMACILQSLGIPAEELPRINCAMLNPSGQESEAAKTLFLAASCLESEQAEALWKALSAHAKVLVSRDAAAAWGRIALWLVALKAAHPSAFLAGALSATGVRSAVTSLAAEARRLGVKIDQPDINRSEAGHSLQRDGEAWAILWGLNHLPSWHSPLTARFLASRPSAGFTSLREVALAAVDSELSVGQLETLVRSGACDALGTLGAPVRDRDAMLAVLPAMFEWARATRHAKGQLDLFTAPNLEPPVEEDLNDDPQSASPAFILRTPHSPRLLYLRRVWEEANIGLAFTQSTEMDSLIATLEKSGDLSSRLLTTAQVDEQHLGTSISLVGILCTIRTLESGMEGEKAPLAVAWLEDAEGSIELVAFPPNYRRHATLWTENSLVIVTARVSRHDDGELYLLSEHIAPFRAGAGEEGMTLTIKPQRPVKAAPKPDSKPAPATNSGQWAARPAPQAIAPASSVSQTGTTRQPALAREERATYSLIISIPPASDDHEVIDSMIALNSLLNAHPGPDSVTIRVQYSPEMGKWTSARLPGGVRFSHALEQSIRRLLGDGALAVIRLAA